MSLERWKILSSRRERSYRVFSLRTDRARSPRTGEAHDFFVLESSSWVNVIPITPAGEVVFLANDRCNQENLIAQLKGGVRALHAPVDNLLSNWAYMVMASLAWSLKAWSALMLPEEGRWAERHGEEKRKVLRMDFATFRRALIAVPAQVARTGRRIVCRLLAWNPWQHVFFRLLDRLARPLRC